jgi:hypothetical protein
MSSQMTQKTVEITIADYAEEAMALNEFYRQRTLALQSMRRSEAEEVQRLTAALEGAKEALVEMQDEVPKLMGSGAAIKDKTGENA